MTYILNNKKIIPIYYLTFSNCSYSQHVILNMVFKYFVYSYKYAWNNAHLNKCLDSTQKWLAFIPKASHFVERISRMKKSVYSDFILECAELFCVESLGWYNYSYLIFLCLPLWTWQKLSHFMCQEQFRSGERKIEMSYSVF